MRTKVLSSRSGRAHWAVRLAATGACVMACFPGAGQTGEPPSAPVILQDLQSFREMGSVLYVAAHPDDENTELIAYLSRGRHYRTAYLSLTRGDGGQNVLGPEFGEELGVIRTEELLAARRVDGGRQFFSRAVDFGFSKDYRETLKIWDQQQVLSDTVRVIREFRPDVIITRFSPVPGGTHGHHTASTVLAREAFKLAGDPKAFPEQLDTLTPWQPERILWNLSPFQRSGNVTNVIRMNAGGKDPVSGESFAEIAARSRSMHKTQGFDNFRGFGNNNGPITESFALLDGAPATNDILDGVDTAWSRVPGGAEIGKLTEAVIAQFDLQNPAASVPALLEIKKRLADLVPDDPVVTEKRGLLDHIIQACLGLTVATTISDAEVVPGETLNLHLTTAVRSDIVPVRWVAVKYPTCKTGFTVGADVTVNTVVSRDSTETLPAGTPLSQPYWLRSDPGVGMFRVDDPALIGRPENPPAFPVEWIFNVGGQTLVVPDQPVQVVVAGTKGEPRRLDVISPVSLKLAAEVGLFAPGATRPVEVQVTSARPDTLGTVRLEAPPGWKVVPAEQSFHLGIAVNQTKFTFQVTAPAQPTNANITATAEVGGKIYDNERVVIHYPHVPLLLLQPPARLKAVCLDLVIRGKKVGYLPGAGDNVAAAIKEMGYDVTLLRGDDLTTNRLKDFDTVVIGVRAFNVRTDLVAHLPALFAYVEAGGNVIEQYNRPGRDLKTDQLAPYSLHLSGDRVTDETAPVTFLAPDHPVLNTPNKITSADFAGWIQERGIYYPDQWDEHFTPILACNDPGEAPLKGGLLVANYGRGRFVYTGLVFFRELPAGVPGAYRLFANLISPGK